MNKVKIDGEKYLYCPSCGGNYCKYNDDVMLFKQISIVIYSKSTGEMTVRCIKCKKEIKIS